MDEKDRVIQNLLKEIGKWKNRAFEAAEVVCKSCNKKICDKCRIRIIKESAEE